jgi:hypothetical protein
MYEQLCLIIFLALIQGRVPGFQVGGGAHLKKLCRAEGGANIFGVFRVKNHDFTPKNARPTLDPPLVLPHY